MVETGGFGRVAWYSKDVMQHEHGHVECIIIARSNVIIEKRAALKEVIKFIHMAGRDIEIARHKGGKELDEIVAMVRKHIPSHPKDSIIESLRPDLNVINYNYLNVDAGAKASFREIMRLALEAGFVKQKIDVQNLVDDSFNTDIVYDKGLK